MIYHWLSYLLLLYDVIAPHKLEVDRYLSSPTWIKAGKRFWEEEI